MKTLEEANKVIVAIGGHSISRGDDILSLDAINDTVEVIMDVCRDKKLAIVHGNGQQLGELEQKYLRALNRGQILDMPIPNELILEIQQSIGILIHGAILNYLFHQKESGRPIVLGRSALVHFTETVVDNDDPSFFYPDMGIGKWVDGNVRLVLENIPFIEHPIDKGKYKEAVASPEPIEVREIDNIREMVDSGFITICGGGIPLIIENGEVFNICCKAVVNKDSTARLIADGVNADVLAIITNVPGFDAGYNTDNPRFQNFMNPEVANWWIRKIGEDGSVSMLSKLKAARDFALKNPSGFSIITDLEGFKKASEGDFSCSTVVSQTPMDV